MANTAKRIFTVTQGNLGQIAGTIVRYFTNQQNSEAENICYIKQKMLELGISTMQNLIFFGWGFIPPPDKETQKRLFQAAVNLVVAATDAIKTFTETAINYVQGARADLWSAVKTNGTEEVPLENPWSVGLCGDVGMYSSAVDDYFRHGLRKSLLLIKIHDESDHVLTRVA